MYSSLKDYLKTPDPEIKEQGVLLFAQDYGIEDTVREIWDIEMNVPILGLGTGVVQDSGGRIEIAYAWELELPNHELRLIRLERENDMLHWIREERVDNAREMLENHDIRMSKQQFHAAVTKRLAVKDWATGSLRRFISKVLAWHQLNI